MSRITPPSGGGGTGTASTAGSAILATGADITTSSNVMAELDSSLRVTVTVPASGTVLVRQSLECYNNTASAAGAVNFGVKPGAGAVVQTGVCVNSGATQRMTGVGERILTGLTPGSMTFQFHWASATNTDISTCDRSTSPAIIPGVWMTVQTLP